MFTRKISLADRIKALFGRQGLAPTALEDLEDALLEADLGPAVVVQLIDALDQLARNQKLPDELTLRRALADMIRPWLKAANLVPASEDLHCYLFLGVNGVGKTTSIAKLARYLQGARPESKIVLAAGDTFRAAASEQLELHGTRLGLRTVRQGAGADSAAVIFDALSSGLARNEQVILADTAGRLHNKAHLVQELEKIDKIVRAKIPGDRYKKILVLDGTTGRNGVQQAEVFHQAIGVDAVILSKYDSGAKGGMVISVCRDLGLGVAFLGTGEAYESLELFDPEVFASRLVGL